MNYRRTLYAGLLSLGVLTYINPLHAHQQVTDDPQRSIPFNDLITEKKIIALEKLLADFNSLKPGDIRENFFRIMSSYKEDYQFLFLALGVGEGLLLSVWHGYNEIQKNPGSYIYAEDRYGRKYSVDLESECKDEKSDHVLLSAHTPIPAAPVRISRERAEIDQEIEIVNFVRGVYTTVPSRGKVTDHVVVKNPDGRYHYEMNQTNLTVYPGESGSAVVPPGKDELLGLISSGKPNDEDNKLRNMKFTTGKNIVDLVRRCLKNLESAVRFN